MRSFPNLGLNCKAFALIQVEHFPLLVHPQQVEPLEARRRAMPS